jgi:hypothetical protein
MSTWWDVSIGFLETTNNQCTYQSHGVGDLSEQDFGWLNSAIVTKIIASELFEA